MVTHVRLRIEANISAYSAGVVRMSVNHPRLSTPVQRRPGRTSRLVALLLVSLLIDPLCAIGQIANPVATALTGATTPEAAGPWSILRNPAARSDRRVLLVASAIGGLPIENGGEGITLFSAPLSDAYGLNVTLGGVSLGPWREVDGAAGLSARFGRLDLGLRLHANVVSIDRYGTSLRPSLDAGLLLPLDGSLRIGLALCNLTGTTRLERRLRQSITTGITFSPDSLLQVTLEVESEVDRGTSIGIGGSYNVGYGLVGRIGLGTGPTTIAFGFGFESNRFRVDYGGALRGDAGLLHSFGGGISW